MIVEFGHKYNKLQKSTCNNSISITEQKSKIVVLNTTSKKSLEQKAIESILNRASRLSW